jgi:hypothetical protein
MRHHVVLVLVLALAACRTKSHDRSDLGAQITAANSSQYCHSPDACFNPQILVLENGYDVTIFAGNNPRHTMLRTEALREYLMGLPMSAWPRGPIIEITPTDVITDSNSVEKNVEQARRICRSLRLDVQFRPGG